MIILTGYKGFVGRNFLKKSEVIDHGIEYIGLGIN